MKNIAIFTAAALLLIFSTESFAQKDYYLKMLKDKKAASYMRKAAMKNLTKEKSADIFAVMTDIIKDIAEPEDLRNDAIAIMIKYKDDSANAAMVEVANNINETDDMRIGVIRALNSLGTKGSISALRELITMKDARGVYLVEIEKALSRIKDKDFVPDFMKLYYHQKEEVRMTAIQYVLEVADRNYLPMLMFLIDDPSPKIKIMFLTWLVKEGDFSAIPKLIESLEIKDDAIRDMIADSLNKIKGGSMKKKFLELLDKFANEEINPKIKPKLKTAYEKIKKDKASADAMKKEEDQ